MTNLLLSEYHNQWDKMSSLKFEIHNIHLTKNPFTLKIHYNSEEIILYEIYQEHDKRFGNRTGEIDICIENQHDLEVARDFIGRQAPHQNEQKYQVYLFFRTFEKVFLHKDNFSSFNSDLKLITLTNLS